MRMRQGSAKIKYEDEVEAACISGKDAKGEPSQAR